ncbi:MAG: hypothetical protein AAGG75_21370 [Bacteroidota bacterium]
MRPFVRLSFGMGLLFWGEDGWRLWRFGGITIENGGRWTANVGVRSDARLLCNFSYRPNRVRPSTVHRRPQLPRAVQADPRPPNPDCR